MNPHEFNAFLRLYKFENQELIGLKINIESTIIVIARSYDIRSDIFYSKPLRYKTIPGILICTVHTRVTTFHDIDIPKRDTRYFFYLTNRRSGSLRVPSSDKNTPFQQFDLLKIHLMPFVLLPNGAIRKLSVVILSTQLSEFHF